MVRIAVVLIVMAAVAWIVVRLHSRGKAASKAEAARDLVNTDVEASNAGKRDDPLA